MLDATVSLGPAALHECSTREMEVKKSTDRSRAWQ